MKTLISIIIACANIAVVAHAQLLPAPVLTGLANYASDGQGTGFSQWEGTLSPQLHVDAYVDTSNVFGNGGGAFANASLIYYMKVDGPAGDVPMHIFAQSYVSTTSFFDLTAGSSGYADAEINIQRLGPTGGGDFNGVQIIRHINAAGPIVAAIDTFDHEVLFPTNTLFKITMTAVAEANASGQWGNALISTFVNLDPIFHIPDSFADKAAYTLEFSPGIENSMATAVPEPGTFTLGSVCVFALVVFDRSRRRRAI